MTGRFHFLSRKPLPEHMTAAEGEQLLAAAEAEVPSQVLPEIVLVEKAADGTMTPKVKSAHMNPAQFAAVQTFLEPIRVVYGGGGLYLGAGHLGKAAGRMVVQGQSGENQLATDICNARRHARDQALTEAAGVGADIVLFTEPITTAVIMNNYTVLLEGSAFKTKPGGENLAQDLVIPTG